MASSLLCCLIMIDFGQVTSLLHLLSFLRCSEQAGITPAPRAVVQSERARTWTGLEWVEGTPAVGRDVVPPAGILLFSLLSLCTPVSVLLLVPCLSSSRR